MGICINYDIPCGIRKAKLVRKYFQPGFIDSCTIILTTLYLVENITKLRFVTCRYIDLSNTEHIFPHIFKDKELYLLSFLSNKNAHSLVYLTKNVILRNSIINQLQQNKCLFTSLID